MATWDDDKQPVVHFRREFLTEFGDGHVSALIEHDSTDFTLFDGQSIARLYFFPLDDSELARRDALASVRTAHAVLTEYLAALENHIDSLPPPKNDY